MFRKSGLLAIALGMMAIGSVTNPAAALTVQPGANLASGAGTKLKPIEVPAGQLPRPQVVPKTRPSYCELNNCIVPSGNRPGR